ncbi:rhodanese-like domain-containing protein [Achromobacter sp. AONIH1]|uniref:rhodanese-like domain-containing protein n=1 Tax=unclassified Achromobacter TaxID=2626865 RepID=UPI0018F8615A|nr:rhodanese-like domain-containing protein [Achromobacter sp. AONIH1]
MDLLQFLLDKNNVFIVAVAVVSGIMLMVPALRKGRAGSAVSTSEAIQMVNQRQAVWVDVRPAEQFQAGHIAQARSVPAADLEQKAGNLPKNKPLIVVCDNGRDSARAAAKLRAQGYADVVPLDGGMRAWLAASLPVTQK